MCHLGFMALTAVGEGKSMPGAQPAALSNPRDMPASAPGLLISPDLSHTSRAHNLEELPPKCFPWRPFPAIPTFPWGHIYTDMWDALLSPFTPPRSGRTYSRAASSLKSPGLMLPAHLQVWKTQAPISLPSSLFCALSGDSLGSLNHHLLLPAPSRDFLSYFQLCKQFVLPIPVLSFKLCQGKGHERTF